MKKITWILFGLVSTLSLNAQSFYNIRNYGACADTTQLSTNAIQKAIDDCFGHGGGTVQVPAGNYLCSTVWLKSNVTLHLDAGATIYASRKLSDYTVSAPFGAADADLGEILIGARNVKNISIEGTGCLNGQAVREMFRRGPQLTVDSVTGREIANAEKYGADYRTKFRKVPPCPGVINFNGCTNVHLRDFQVVESSQWSVHLQWCEQVYVDGMQIQSSSYNGVNADGLDIDGCSNVMISNCVINTGDDALCLKTTRLEGKSKPCRWVTINNCILTSSSSAFKLGTESYSDFENIVMTNCLIKDANRGICMIIRDGATVKNILFSNIVINTIRKATFWWGNGDAVWLTIQKRGNAALGGKIENVTFSHILAHSQSGVRLEGFSNRMENVSFDGFQLFMEHEDAVDKRSRNGFLFDGVNKLSVMNCEVIWNKANPEPVWESAYLFKNVDGLKMNQMEGEQAPNKKYPAVRMQHVKDSMTR